MKKYINSRQYLLGVAHTSYMNQPTNMVYIFKFRTDEKMRSCHFIPNKVLYAVIFYDTQFYVGTHYN